jgi:miniconductance mechanosensitive channel
MNSVRFCSHEELVRFRDMGLVADEEMKDEIANSTVFRRYLMKHLGELPAVNSDMTLMVRQLQPTEHGLPIELYFFTASKVWAKHETDQADIFDYVIASLPKFGLRVFQSPSGVDFRKLESVYLIFVGKCKRALNFFMWIVPLLSCVLHRMPFASMLRYDGL